MPADGITFKDVTVAYERQWIESALEAAGGVQKRAAELLRIKPTTLNEMIKRYDIGARRSRRPAAGSEDEDEASAAGPYDGDETLKPS
jgi:DNA-binding NtrC family response regulator